MSTVTVEKNESMSNNNNNIATTKESSSSQSSKLLIDLGRNIESHRCLATELEACISLTTILIQNPNGLSVPELEHHQKQKKHNNINNGTISVIDEKQEISSSQHEQQHQQQQQDSSSDNNNTIPKGVLDAIETLQKIGSTIPNIDTNDMNDNNNNATTKTMVMTPGKNSQLYKSCRTTALKTSLKRINELTYNLKSEMKNDNMLLEQMKQLQQQRKDDDDGDDEEKVSKLYLEAFYEKLRHVKEYHAKYGTTTNEQDQQQQQGGQQRPTKRQRYGNVEADGYDLSSIINTTCSTIPNGTKFSIEEVLGKYLDFTSMHEYIISDFSDFFIPSTTAIKNNNSYVDFLQILSKLDDNSSNSYFSSAWKLSNRKKYNHVLTMLRTYLEDFLSRAFPLYNIQTDIILPALQEKQKLQNKDNKDNNDNNNDDNNNAINWDTIKSIDDLLTKYTPIELKTYLQKLNMKCGGTPNERAKRLFLTKDTPLDKLPAKLFVNKSKQEKNNLDILELIVFALLQQLRPTLESTIRRAERRLTQTISEKERELEEEMYGDTSILALSKRSGDGDGNNDNEDDDEEEEEDAPIYNPKGVPLGWDGKPIPYWLFKLHGLNHFFTCEICGNESYRGRHTFEKHFTESKHAYGMRCLGIPNTKHFHGITNIEDAKSLWEKLSTRMENDVFDAEKEEEYEDSHGNVLSRAAYEDLARQGML